MAGKNSLAALGQIVDVSSPTAPRIVSTLDTPGSAKGIAVAGGYAYVADDTSVRVVSVTSPANPAVVGTLAVTATTIAVGGNRAYVIGNGQLRIVDISSPTAPALLSASAGHGAQAVDVTGTMVFLATPALDHFDQTGGVYVVNAAVATRPTLVDQIIVPGLTRTVAATPSYIYTGDSAAVLDGIAVVP